MDSAKNYLLNDLIDKGIDLEKAWEAIEKYSDSFYVYKHFGINVPRDYEIKQEGLQSEDAKFVGNI